MKNQILDPMTCELQVGDVVQVISSGDKYIAEIIKIDGESCPFQIQTKTGWIMWRKRSELRLVSRPHQPEKTMKTSEQLQNLAKNVASLVEAISEAADMAEYFEAKENGENALREINKKLGDRVDELESKLRGERESKEEWKEECGNLEAKLHELRNVERRNESLAEQVKILTELNIKNNANERAYKEQIRGLNAQIIGLEEQKQIQHERNQELLDKLKASNLLVESQRELMQIPSYVGLMMYVSEFSQKHQISTSSVWDMFFSVCKRAVFTIPEAPEPVEPPVTDDFKECRGGFDCNLNANHSK